MFKFVVPRPIRSRLFLLQEEVTVRDERPDLELNGELSI